MKKLFTILLIPFCIKAFAQTPESIYEASSDDAMNRFEFDNNFLYVVRDKSVDKIDAKTNVTTKLFDKPWGSSVNASATAIFSNGKSIIGQYTPGNPRKYKYWAYNGSTFDTLFTINNSQITQWATDGDVCYFFVNNKIYKSDFTSAGTMVIANLPTNNLTVSMIVYNSDLYYFNTTNTASNNALKKYSGSVLSVVDSSAGFAVSDYQMKIQNNELYISHYQFNGVPEKYKSDIFKINNGQTTNLYTSENAASIYNQGFLGMVNNELFLHAANGPISTPYVYKINALTSSVPKLLLTATGASLNHVSSTTSKQGKSILYLNVYDNTKQYTGDRDLWQTDGTPAGTIKVPASATADITNSRGYGLGNVDYWSLQGVTCGNKIYSILNTFELWEVDASTPPTKIAIPNYQFIGTLAISSGNIFMVATNSTTYKKHILKLNCNSLSNVNDAISINNNLEVFPNPSNGKFEITFEKTPVKMESVEIYNLVGEKMSFEYTSSSIDFSAQPKGLYFVKYTNGINSINRKVVVQ